MDLSGQPASAGGRIDGDVGRFPGVGPRRCGVTRVLPFGALVETIEGGPGLLMNHGPVRAGVQVEARIDTIDSARRRVSLIGA